MLATIRTMARAKAATTESEPEVRLLSVPWCPDEIEPPQAR